MPIKAILLARMGLALVRAFATAIVFRVDLEMQIRNLLIHLLPSTADDVWLLFSYLHLLTIFLGNQTSAFTFTVLLDFQRQAPCTFSLFESQHLEKNVKCKQKTTTQASKLKYAR